MNMRVWKYQFRIIDEVQIEMPTGAKIIHVESQDGVPTLWALVNGLATKEIRHFRIVGTGHLIAAEMEHVASFQMAGGTLVWHLFQVNAALRS